LSLLLVAFDDDLGTAHDLCVLFGQSFRRLCVTVALAALGLTVCVGASGAAVPGLSWSGPATIDHNAPAYPAGIACATVATCTVVDEEGQESTFDPGSPGGATLSVIPSPGGFDVFSAVACPSATQCAAVDHFGEETTFDPTSSTMPAPVRIDNYAATHVYTDFVVVACPSTTQCTAVDIGGKEYTFNPQSPPSPGAAAATIPGGSNFDAIACPSVTQCTAITAYGAEATFDPQSPGSVLSSAGIDANMLSEGVDCPSVTQCTLVDSYGRVMTFNPQSPGTPTATQVDADAMWQVACPATTQCTAVDLGGREVTFDPQAPAGASPVSVDSGTAQLRGVACPSASQCTAVDGAGLVVTFDPGSPGTPTPVLVDSAPYELLSVACPTATQCTTFDAPGQEVTIDPTSPGNPTPVAIDAGGNSSGGNLPGVRIACPSATQCTVVDASGREVTFDPQAPGSPTPVAFDSASGYLTQVACPATTQCTTVDDIGREFTFNPQSPSITPIPLAAGGTYMLGLACPSTTQCTAIDDQANEVTFNPQSPGGAKTTAIAIPADFFHWPVISCPSTTLCVLVNNGGAEETFNPQSPATQTTGAIENGVQVTALACPSTAECSAVDASGRAITFNPGQPWLQAVTPVPQAGFLHGVDCVSTEMCVAVDGIGQAFWTDSLQYTVLTNGPHDPTSATTASFSFTSDDGAATFECSLDGSSWHACTSPASYSGLSGGSHTFEVRADGGAGVDTSPASETWMIATPDTAITAAPAPTTFKTSASFSFTSTDPAAVFQCSLDGSSWHGCTSPASYTGMSAGSHTFRVRAVHGTLIDPSPASTTWTIQEPDTRITAGPAKPTLVRSATFSFKSADSHATFQCSLDTSPWKACSSPARYSGLRNGVHTFRVRAIDGILVDPTPAVRNWAVGTFKLTVAKSGSGKVTSTPAGIKCGATCSHGFTSGAWVTLTAVAKAGSVFTGWSGACSGTGKCKLAMNAAESVTATFAVIHPTRRGTRSRR
jgi:hypothetical protein